HDFGVRLFRRALIGHALLLDRIQQGGNHAIGSLRQLEQHEVPLRGVQGDADLGVLLDRHHVASKATTRSLRVLMAFTAAARIISLATASASGRPMPVTVPASGMIGWTFCAEKPISSAG